ncbi:hypothetical protein [Tranquillimonas rosea]|uniref:hypothetical protein n=1 Tax=Tranquillimonas rosea TaxID=641238 RepID=UPI0011604944|nr:hypothetical protein [Tranquillimonas rosea]
MPTEAAARCALQAARKRRLSVYPDRFGMEQDICDVTLWLVEKYGLSGVRVYVDRHYIHVGREMAGVTVMTAPRHPAQLSEAAHRAFLALGYTIEDTRADIYGHQHCDGHHSRHEALRAYGRIESAIKAAAAPE